MKLLLLNILLCTSLLLTCSDKTDKTEGQSDIGGIRAHADSLVIQLTGRDSLTVFELLEEKHRLDYKKTLQGVFILAIDSIANDDSHFWLYSVNDTMAQVACDKYVTSDGDRVRWIYRSIE